MASAPTAMLFCPPQPPVTLDGDARVLLGRSRSCQLRLAETDASRRHAEISARDGGFVIRDLGSTNGTYVNGERIEEHQLEPGDRIQIGSEKITFCRVAAEPERGGQTLSDEKTVLYERPAYGEVFQGDFAEIPPFAVVQMLELGGKSGLLQLDSDEGDGKLWFSGGKPVHAITKSQVGFDAAITLVNASSGRFAFDPSGDPPDHTIEASVTELLLEASKTLDESR